MPDMPARDVHIDDDLVRALLAEQHPDLADLAVRHAAEGWDCVVVRLGDDLAVRLPRRALAAGAEANALDWLPRLVAERAEPLPLAIAVPVRVGMPGCGYPYRWSVVPWFEGATADEQPAEPTAAAATLGRFMAAFAAPAPADAPTNPWRGVPLAARDERTRVAIASLPRAIVDSATIVWDEALSATPHPSDDRRWVHGDLHPANLIVRDGQLVAVIDFNDLCAGDPSTDLAAGWMLFDADHHTVFRSAAGPIGLDDDAWTRARGWALAHGALTIASSADNPRMRAMGERTLARVLA